jgi:hypothetical protein
MEPSTRGCGAGGARRDPVLGLSAGTGDGLVTIGPRETNLTVDAGIVFTG